ncbi:MAG: DUF1598 domain-containing protein [Pirellulales bacterium]|nr:DUF1598 domain-containing protein [Pirellulales bacterium]
MSSDYARNYLAPFCRLFFTCAFATFISTAPVLAQDDGGGGDGDGGDGTIGVGSTSGVAVDADGVLRRLTVNDYTGQLNRQRAQEAFAQLDAEITKPSQLRKVSLTRLARLIRKAIDEGHGPDEAMKHLAGLTRIKYVFYYPETQDIVLAGPAEGWAETVSGRVLGLQSGRPVLELQDLIVALRAFPPGKKSNPLVYCSIDATPEGLARMQNFLSHIGRQIVPGDEQIIVEGLRESLGLQVITLGGIPASTHFAQVMVEADYRMKLIGIGLEEPPARIKSYVSLASFSSIARNAMCRWWFVPDYKRIRVTQDRHALEFVGVGVKLVGEDEVISSDGTRQQSGNQNRASRRFTQNFTDKYAHLADRAPVYGQLRNCIDMLVAAAFLQEQDLYGLADWDLKVLGDESIYPVETYNAPQHVASAVNSIWKGRRLATPIGGGVQIRARQALDSENLIADDKGALREAHDAVSIDELPADKWWWD